MFSLSIIALNFSIAQVTETKILPSDPENINSFGFSVAMDGTAMVTGCGDANYLGPKTGVALVFRNKNGEWVEDSILMPNDWTDAARFGWSVDVQDDYLFISSVHDGANGLWAGAVYVYKWDGIQWLEQQKLYDSNVIINIGYGICISMEENLAIIGAPEDTENGVNAGAVYIYENEGSHWNETTRLIAGNNNS